MSAENNQALTTTPPKRPPRPARTKGQQELDRARVSELYVKGWPLAKIAAEVKLSIPTVHRDLKRVRTEWLERSVEAFDKAKARELARIDVIESEAWEAWKDSRSERQRTTTKRVEAAAVPEGQKKPPPLRNEASVMREKRDGNPQYLQTVQWCVEQRCKIFGLYAPTRFSLAELDQLIEGELGRLAGGGGGVPAIDISAEAGEPR